MGQVVSINAHKKRKRRNGSFKWFRFIFFCLVCALIGFGISQSPLFNVRHVVVEGNENIDTQLILDLSGVEDGQHIYSFSAGRAETMIGTNPLVQQVTVSRRLPSTVKITVVERQPLAAIAAGDGVIIVDKEGYVLKKQKLFDGLSCMLLIGVDDLKMAADEVKNLVDKAAGDESEDKPEDEQEPADSADKQKSSAGDDTEDSEDKKDETNELSGDEQEADKEINLASADHAAYASVKSYDEIKSGVRLESDKLQVGLRVSAEIMDTAHEEVTQITVRDPQNIILDTVYGIKIYFGDENDISEKFSVCKSIMEDEKAKGHITKIQYIDISVPAHPALKYNEAQ